MPQKSLVKLKSTASAHVYYTRRKKTSKGAQNKEKMSLKKFDPTVKKRVEYKQSKK